MERAIPPVLRGGIWALGVITVLTFLAALARPAVPIFVTVAGDIALLIGLCRGHRWAFVLTIVTSVGGALMMLSRSVPLGLLVLIVNATVFVPVILARDYFFEPRETSGEFFDEGHVA